VLIGLVGGLITGISPCVLPVLPAIFFTGGAASARPVGPREMKKASRRPYWVVGGLTLSFSIFTLVGTIILRSLDVPADTIRWVGLAVLVLLGLGMIIPQLETLLEKPFSWIPQRNVRPDSGGFILGLALGAVYVPCAGPVLAAITVAGATGRIGGRTIELTVAFAIGTAIPLLIFALAGRGVAERVRAFRTHQRAIRITAGVVVIGLAVALTFNVTDALQRAVPDYTAAANKALIGSKTINKALGKKSSALLADCAQNPSDSLANCGAAPQISGIAKWLNTPGDAPISLSGLKGKVVLVDFWAYSCINCQRAIPHVEAWYSTYKSAGFEVIGVHTPEYAFEHVASNVAAGAKRIGITYPVALDNDYTTWNAFSNDSWPADYLIDSTGTIRHVSVGEGDYSGTEKLIRALLAAAKPGAALPRSTDVKDVTPDIPDQTAETYLGANRANSYGGTQSLGLGKNVVSFPSSLPSNEFALAGTWTIGDEALTAGPNARIRLNYLAQDVYLDIGGTGTITATSNGVTKTFKVSGAPDIYTVVSQKSATRHTVDISVSPGLTAYSFTFG
jgi:cytochrome c biogenesis protein CcdA/thiol-disulfide isomerase/thioredoxin